MIWKVEASCSRSCRSNWRPPLEQLTADLLRRIIAARVQEEAFGTLDRATLKLLDDLARHRTRAISAAASTGTDA
jgi:hypothetical protein